MAGVPFKRSKQKKQDRKNNPKGGTGEGDARLFSRFSFSSSSNFESRLDDLLENTRKIYKEIHSLTSAVEQAEAESVQKAREAAIAEAVAECKRGMTERLAASNQPPESGQPAAPSGVMAESETLPYHRLLGVTRTAPSGPRVSHNQRSPSRPEVSAAYFSPRTPTRQQEPEVVSTGPQKVSEERVTIAYNKDIQRTYSSPTYCQDLLDKQLGIGQKNTKEEGSFSQEGKPNEHSSSVYHENRQVGPAAIYQNRPRLEGIKKMYQRDAGKDSSSPVHHRDMFEESPKVYQRNTSEDWLPSTFYQRNRSEDFLPKKVYQRIASEDCLPTKGYQQNASEDCLPKNVYHKNANEASLSPMVYQRIRSEGFLLANVHQKSTREDLLPFGSHRDTREEQSSPVLKRTGHGDRCLTGASPRDLCGKYSMPAYREDAWGERPSLGCYRNAGQGLLSSTYQTGPCAHHAVSGYQEGDSKDPVYPGKGDGLRAIQTLQEAVREHESPRDRLEKWLEDVKHRLHLDSAENETERNQRTDFANCSLNSNIPLTDRPTNREASSDAVNTSNNLRIKSLVDLTKHLSVPKFQGLYEENPLRTAGKADCKNQVLNVSVSLQDVVECSEGLKNSESKKQDLDYIQPKDKEILKSSVFPDKENKLEIRHISPSDCDSLNSVKHPSFLWKTFICDCARSQIKKK